MLHKYEKGRERFFDNIVIFLGSLCGMSSVVATQRFGPQRPMEPRFDIIVRGRPNISGIELVFRPYELLRALSENSWPQVIEWTERPLVSTPASMGLSRAGLKGFNQFLLESCFVHYFESIRGDVNAKYGSDPTAWPMAVNFGRVVRNSFAHGGRINFENRRSPGVSWRTLSYSPRDNGRVISFRDVTAVEMILLMEDVDAAL